MPGPINNAIRTDVLIALVFYLYPKLVPPASRVSKVHLLVTRKDVPFVSLVIVYIPLRLFRGYLLYLYK